jgi:hypothetical protein
MKENYFERNRVKKQFEYYKEKQINSVHQHCILKIVNKYFYQVCMNGYVPFFPP